MEDWHKDFLAMLETVTGEFEQFFQEVGEAVESVADEIGETLEAFGEEVHSTFTPEVNEYFQELFEPLIEISVDIENVVFEDWLEDTEFAINPKVEPTLEYPACVGCQHYHGRMYSGNLLVCAIHPYGWDDENCPDWEEKASSSFYDDLF